MGRFSPEARILRQFPVADIWSLTGVVRSQRIPSPGSRRPYGGNNRPASRFAARPPLIFDACTGCRWPPLFGKRARPVRGWHRRGYRSSLSHSNTSQGLSSRPTPPFYFYTGQPRSRMGRNLLPERVLASRRGWSCPELLVPSAPNSRAMFPTAVTRVFATSVPRGYMEPAPLRHVTQAPPRV